MAEFGILRLITKFNFSTFGVKTSKVALFMLFCKPFFHIFLVH